MEICFCLDDLDELAMLLWEDHEALFELEEVRHRELVELEEVVVICAMDEHERAQLIRVKTGVDGVG
jgi:hypothetical protein